MSVTVQSVASTALDEHAATEFDEGLLNLLQWSDLPIPDHHRAGLGTAGEPRGPHRGKRGFPLAPTGNHSRQHSPREVHRRERYCRTSHIHAESGSHGTPAIANDTVYIGAYDGALIETGPRNRRGGAGGRTWAMPSARVRPTTTGRCTSLSSTRLRAGALSLSTPRPVTCSGATADRPTTPTRRCTGPRARPPAVWLERRLLLRVVVSGSRQVWRYDTGGDVKAPIAVADGTAIVPSWAETVTAVDVTDGSERWTFEADADVMCAPAVHDGTVYVGSHDDRVMQ